LKKVKIFTDGACSGNPGPGGWAAILKFDDFEKKICGSEVKTTNNRMELTAIIKALEILEEPHYIDAYSDSRYIVDAVNKGWAKKWRANNWMRDKKNPALNSDLWERLLDLISKHKFNLNWVHGHSGHPENEECDKMAVDSWKKLRTCSGKGFYHES
jgi:ribonuclease HI